MVCPIKSPGFQKSPQKISKYLQWDPVNIPHEISLTAPEYHLIKSPQDPHNISCASFAYAVFWVIIVIVIVLIAFLIVAIVVWYAFFRAGPPVKKPPRFGGRPHTPSQSGTVYAQISPIPVLFSIPLSLPFMQLSPSVEFNWSFFLPSPTPQCKC